MDAFKRYFCVPIQASPTACGLFIPCWECFCKHEMAFFKWRSSCDVILFKSSHDSMTRDSKANVHRSHFWARSPMEHRILPTGSLIMISICFQKANKMVKAIHNIAVPNVNHDFTSDCQKFNHAMREFMIWSRHCVLLETLLNTFETNKCRIH